MRGPKLRSLVVALLTALAVALSSSGLASAADLYVKPSGVASGDCSKSSACDVSYAVNQKSKDGDSVIVKDGTYVVPAPLVAVYDVTIRSESPNVRPTIVNDGSGQTEVTRSFPGQAYPVTFLIDRSTLFASGRSTIEGLNIVQTGSGARAVAGENFERVIATASGSGGTAVLVGGNGIVRDSVAYAPGTGSTAVEATGATSKLRNVTALATGPGGVALRANDDGGAGVLSSILLGGYADAILLDGDLQLATSNVRIEKVIKVGSGAVTLQGTNQSELPKLADPDHGDFHESASSPTIDAGDTDGFSGINDLDYGARKEGKSVDLGADEYKAPVVSRACLRAKARYLKAKKVLKKKRTQHASKRVLSNVRKKALVAKRAAKKTCR